MTTPTHTPPARVETLVRLSEQLDRTITRHGDDGREARQDAAHGVNETIWAALRGRPAETALVALWVPA